MIGCVNLPLFRGIMQPIYHILADLCILLEFRNSNPIAITQVVTASRSAIEEEATPSKWKSEEERSNVIAPSAAAASSEMASMVRAWQNPNFQHVTEVPAAVRKSRMLNSGPVRFKGRIRQSRLPYLI